MIKNHAFIDGNKRIGLAILIGFVEVNGYTVTASEDEAKVTVLRAAASELKEDEWTAWVERSIAPMAP